MAFDGVVCRCEIYTPWVFWQNFEAGSRRPKRASDSLYVVQKPPPHKAGVDRYTSRVIIVSIVICVPVNPSANLQA
jgi:hypothetical protein